MARTQKLFKLYTIAEFNAEDGMSESATYAKDKRGAMRTFEQGQHTGTYVLVWDNGAEIVNL